MLLAIEATFKGLWRALFSVRSVFFLYLPNLGLSACVAVPIYALFNASLASNPDARALVERHDPAFVDDFLRVHSEPFAALGSAIAVAAILWYLTWTFVEGGALAALSDPTRRLTLTGFFAACGRNFFAFLRGLVPAAIATVLLVLLNSQASRLVTWYFDDYLRGSASAAALGWTLTCKTILFLLLFVFLVAAPTAFARVRAVVEDDRSMLRGYFRGVALCLSRPLTILVFVVLQAALFGAVLLGADEFARRVPLDHDWAPLAGLVRDGVTSFDPRIPPVGLHITVWQLALWLLMTLLVARCAGLVAIWRATTEPRVQRDPELVYARGPVVDAPSPRSRSVSRAPKRGYDLADDDVQVGG